MLWIFFGVLLFGLLHAIPVVAPKTRRSVMKTVGVLPYKLLFILALLSTINIIVQGWIYAYPEHIYAPFPWASKVSIWLILLSFILLVAGSLKTNIKQFLRHPQLTGLMIWAFAHLLANGDSRSVTLFGGFMVWAGLMIIGINIRDGIWIKPEKVSWIKDAIVIVVGVALYSAIVMFHESFTGVSPMG